VRDLEVTIAALDGSTSEIESEDEVDIVLAADVFFAFGEATLTPAASQALAALAEQLRERASGRVAVVGHTDAVGSTAANLQLSLARAQAVVAALTPQVPGLQLIASGKGETEPVAVETVEGKDDPAARARNRRVAITYQKA
jgi:outer membrane protein OmpA-like peptidoglycan-associated protein